MMLCAVCLYERLTTFPSGPLLPRDAITIANGQAVCGDHFQSIARKVTPDHGQVALAELARPDILSR